MEVWRNYAGTPSHGSVAAGSFGAEPGNFGRVEVAGTFAEEEPSQNKEPLAGRAGGSLAQRCQRVEVLQKAFATS